MKASASIPFAKELFLIGGGHTHSLVMRMFGMKPLAGVRLTLISDVSHTPYSGMLPGHIAGLYGWEEMHIDLRRLCRFAGARFIQGELTNLDLANRRIQIADRPPLAFDVISLNTGSTPAENNVPGAAAFAIAAKPVAPLLEKWEAICAEAASGRPARIVVVGGGAGGVELALNMHARLTMLLRNDGTTEVTLVHAGPALMPGHNDRVRALLTRELASRRVRIITGERIVEVHKNAAVCAGGETLPADHIFWVTDAAPPSWLRTSGLQLDERGFAAVNDTLQSLSHDFVFAVGDVATVATEPRPKSGVFAVRAARPLVENFRRYFAAQPLVHWQPQRHFLSLIGTGRKEAVASRHWLAIKGRWCWELKDWIDRRFMRRFEQLPAMGAPDALRGDAALRGDGGDPLAGEIETLRARAKMRCFGCAAKVGGATLERVMNRLRENFGDLLLPSQREDVLVALDSPDDATAFVVPEGRALVQTVDYMPALLADPHLFARIATLHGFSDIFAMGAQPHSALLAALLPFEAQAITSETLYQVVSGVLVELRKMHALLLGGHTAEAAMLGIALTCNGLAEANRLFRKSGLEPGQALILTKPLGIGVLFAAEMRLAAKGAWIESAIESMLCSNQTASQILRHHSASALTDVTGFGLAGHLLEMVRASKVGAVLAMDHLPLLPGAESCAANGLSSSLYPQNSRAMSAIANAADFAAHTRFPLLFDPQTSGGLLAGVPDDRADACVEMLRATGCPQATIVGRVTEMEDSQVPVILSSGAL